RALSLGGPPATRWAPSTWRTSTTGWRRVIARARSSSRRKLTARRWRSVSGSGTTAGSPSKVSAGRPWSRSRCQRSRLVSRPASESAIETSTSPVGPSGVTMQIDASGPARRTASISAPSRSMIRVRVTGACGSSKTVNDHRPASPVGRTRRKPMPRTPRAAASDLASTTLIDPGSPTGSTRRRPVHTGRPVVVARRLATTDAGRVPTSCPSEVAPDPAAALEQLPPLLGPGAHLLPVVVEQLDRRLRLQEGVAGHGQHAPAVDLHALGAPAPRLGRLGAQGDLQEALEHQIGRAH